VYGSRRFTVIEAVATVAQHVARAGRLFLNLATSHASWSLTNLYAAAATARFMTAHELIDQAEDLVGDDPDTDLVQVNQPAWFGFTTLHEEN
jgi:hypothetical protein